MALLLVRRHLWLGRELTGWRARPAGRRPLMLLFLAGNVMDMSEKYRLKQIEARTSKFKI
jgi:hypothetical protein